MVDFEYQQMVRAAWNYYLQEHTQQEVANYLGVSRAKVIRLLNDAREQGVIQFVFRPEDDKRMSVEQDLISRYGLKDAYVVPREDSDSIKESVARAAAQYISQHLGDGGFLNVGYGDTMGAILKYLANGGKRDLNVISLTGGVNYYLPMVGASAFNLRLFLIPAPLVVSSVEVRDALMQEPGVQEVLRMSSHSNMSVVGIGAMTSDATVMRNGIISQSEFTMLSMQNAVGDVLDHFVDADCNLIATDIEDRLVGTSLEDLKQMDNVVGVAGGPDKADAIRAVLKGGCLDILITDEGTAQAILA